MRQPRVVLALGTALAVVAGLAFIMATPPEAKAGVASPTFVEAVVNVDEPNAVAEACANLGWTPGLTAPAMGESTVQVTALAHLDRIEFRRQGIGLYTLLRTHSNGAPVPAVNYAQQVRGGLGLAEMRNIATIGEPGVKCRSEINPGQSYTLRVRLER